MFLTNKMKTTGNIKTKTSNNKALGGWDDDQSDTTSTPTYNKFKDSNNTNNTFLTKPPQKETSKQNTNVDLLGERQQTEIFEFGFKETKMPEKQISSQQNKAKQTQRLFSAAQLNSMLKIECERKVVEEVLALGGIRVKQSDAVLNQFYNEAKGMDIPIIGSLLISNLQNQEASFEIKAKSIYAIEHLCKKSIQYSVYFKLHSETIKNSPDSQDHQQNYLKIKKTLLGTLGTLIVKPEERKLIEEELSTKEGINFVDPGYNKGEDEGVLGFITKKNSQKTETQKTNKKLISPFDAKTKQKKVLEGPGSKKIKNETEDLLGVSKIQPGKTQVKNSKQQYNLIDVNVEKKEDNLLSFEEVGARQTNRQLI